jgi:predicted metalloprotease with PDZ domain
LDSTHGYFNGAALFCYIPGLEQLPITVEIIPPQSHWRVTTVLPELKPNTFSAIDFDTLVDSPFEIGTHQIYDFQVLDKPHQLAIWGEGNIDAEKVVEDTKKLILAEVELYGDLPYDRYIFLLHLSSNGYGGLEHKNCCTLNYPRFGFRAKDKYNRFMQLVAHEFFHLWNVKRIRPKALEKFDYDGENYTNCLWFSEGTTSYYDVLLPLRAKVYDSKTFFKNLGADITKYLTTPGRKVQPLSESSFDAWIKLYRRDNNSDNCQISYYLKGQMLSLLLDLLIRNRHNNQRSLDDVMRKMWEKFGRHEVGFTPFDLQSVIESVAETDLNEFFQRYLEETEELPFAEYLQPFGLEIKPIFEEETLPYLGIKLKTENNRQIINFVEADSPAALAGIDSGDELLAMDGFRVTAEQLNDRLKDYQEGAIVEIAAFHQDKLYIYKVKLASPQPSRYELVQTEHASESQKQMLNGWLAC